MTLFIKKRREFIVEEKDVITILSEVDRNSNISRYNIGKCGWADNPTKWFVSFYATDKQYGKIMKSLTKNGKFIVNTRPGGLVDLWFEKN